MRDVIYDQDRSQVRTGSAPQVMATLRSTAIGLLRAAGFDNIAQANRHMIGDEARPLRLLHLTLPGPWVAQRRMTLFGQERGAIGTWPGERGFVDGMIDASTGLTQLGARAYDADLGRFISVDPLMDLADSQQMHGYAYSNNNPVTFSDADGLILCQDPRLPDCARVDDDTGRYVYTGHRGFNSTGYAAGSAYGTGSRPIQPGWTRVPTSTSVRNPGSQPAPAPPLVNATVSSEEQSLWDAAWGGVKGWANDRYRTDDGGWNVGNMFDDALPLTGVLCAACAVGVAGLSIARGLWKVGSGDTTNGVWDIAGAIVPGGAGRLIVSRGKKGCFRCA